MKKLIKGILLPLMIFALLMAGAPPALASSVTATPTRQTIMMKNAIVPLRGYAIDGYNYFKLRDLAMALSGSLKCFSVSWDDASKTILLQSKENYIPVGGELAWSNAGGSVAAVPSSAVISLNSRTIDLTGYTIGGNNYFKLRDVAKYINFSVLYNEATDTVNLDPSDTYYVDTLMEQLKGGGSNTLVRDYVNNTVSYYGLTTGSMIIREYTETWYKISATNISNDSDEAVYRSVLALFFSDPDQVINALKRSASEGKKTLSIGGMDVKCLINKQDWSVEILW